MGQQQSGGKGKKPKKLDTATFTFAQQPAKLSPVNNVTTSTNASIAKPTTPTNQPSAQITAQAASPAEFIADGANPFCGPLDHIRDEERPLLALADSSHFDLPTLRKLQEIFNDISESGTDDGVIDAAELTQAMGLDRDCLLARALFRIFDLTKTRRINFRTWVTTLSALSQKASMDEKIRFSFSLYDMNDDGMIDLNELRTLLAAAVRENVLSLSELEVQAVCDHTLRHVDKDHNGTVDFNEYRQVVCKSRRFVESFTMDIPRMLQSFRVDKRLTDSEAARKQELWVKRQEKQKQRDDQNADEDGKLPDASSSGVDAASTAVTDDAATVNDPSAMSGLDV